MATPDTGALPEPIPGVWLYVAGFGVCACAIYAAVSALGLDDPAFLVVVLGLCAVGYLVSYQTRRLPSAGWSIAALAGSIVGVLALRGGGEGADALLTAGGDGSVHGNLGVFLCWLLVLLSFAQLSPGWILFTCVPAAAILGLSGTVYTEADFLWVYLVFVALATFMMIHEHHHRLHWQRKGLAAYGNVDLRLLGQAYVAAACSLGAIAVGRVVAEPMHSVASALFPFYNMVDSSRNAEQRASTNRIGVSETAELTIGRGPMTISEQVLMRVRAEHGAYWRGATYDRYTGAGWRSSLPGAIDVGPRPARGEPSVFVDPSERRSLEIQVPRTRHNRTPGAFHILRQSVLLEPVGRFTDLYAAGEARSFRLADDTVAGLSVTAAADLAGRVRLSYPIRGIPYEAISEVADWTPEELRQRTASMESRLMAGYLRLDLPSADFSKLRGVVDRITATARNDYDRVVALQDYVSSSCRYNLMAPALDSAGGDMVLQFLFRTREGYCDLFASALAVLCRTAGIPARVASGFTSGEFDPARAEYVVRERDKHLWCEVWFSDTGWVVFDPTTNAEDVTPVPGANQGEPGFGALRRLLQRGPIPPAIVGTALGLVLWAVRTEWRHRRSKRDRRDRVDTLGPIETEVLRVYAMVSRSLSRRGMSRRPSETPWEYADRLVNALADDATARHAVLALTQKAVAARYAGVAMGPGDVRQMHRWRRMVLGSLRSSRSQAFLRQPPPRSVH